ncbi:MAG: ABC-F family ATP-binding cassette domain-containing protein [Cyclobacteriaceae bacterium]|nr:ABC-F family ATP-binding cassette domain-containing protein [Cyclobacteriaceae bacterium]
MNYLSAESLTKSYGDRTLFDKISFGVDQGQKVALVGINGSGKSTLLKIIMGQETPDSGKVSFRNDIKISFLSQNPEFKIEDSILDAVFDSDDEKLSVIKAYEHQLALIEINPDAHEKLTELIEKMDNLNAWDYESEIKQILGKLGIHDLEKKVSELSGGQKKRVAMAKALVEHPDFLIMDEPTNHLDLEIIEWLEEYLSKSNLSLLLVTHDRYFLESVTSHILEIDREKIFKYVGSYSDYLEKKAEREEQERTEVSKARNLMKKELDWIRRQPKARGTKAKYRIDAFEKTKEKASQNLTKTELELDLNSKRQGKKIIELDKASKSFDDTTIIHPFSHVFKRGDRIGIVGKNGVGKSTFLNLLTGKLTPDSGEIEIGKNTEFGYYTQQELQFKAGQKVIDIVKEIAEVITMSDGSTISASQFLQHFQFAPKVQHDFVEKLSGGEKRRLQLLRVLIKNPNFLILDEPTNDLDLITLGILEDFLSNFPGCLLIVSHDRYFMDRLVDHVFVFEKNKPIKEYPYNYSQYRSFANEQVKALTTKSSVKSKNEKNKHEQKTKLSYNEKKEFEGLESEIEQLESTKESLFEKLNSGNGSLDELQQWGKEIEEIIAEIEAKEMRWLELSEIIEA